MDIQRVSINSANYSHNRYKKTGIVLHWIVGEISAADATFQNPNRKASATFAIGSNGEIHQYMEEDETAFHSGNGAINRSHFGIEHAGGQLINNQRKTPTPACHESSAQLVAYLCKKYGIACNRTNIIKHNQIVATSCPGTLDIDYILARANQILNPALQPIPEPQPAPVVPQPTPDYVAILQQTSDQLQQKIFEEQEMLLQQLLHMRESLQNQTSNLQNQLGELDSQLKATFNQVINSTVETIENPPTRQSLMQSIINGWGNIVDRLSKLFPILDNDVVRGFLKYNIIVYIGAAINYVAIYVLTLQIPLPKEIQPYSQTIIAFIALLLGGIYKDLLPNYDTNHDNVLDYRDTI